MKNSLADLNNHLFETLERLNDETLSEEQIRQEVTRSAAIIDVSKQILDNGKLQLELLQFQSNIKNIMPEVVPELLQIEKKTI